MLQSTLPAADAAAHVLPKADLPVPARTIGAHDTSRCSRPGALVAHTVTVAVAAAVQEWVR